MSPQRVPGSFALDPSILTTYANGSTGDNQQVAEVVPHEIGRVHGPNGVTVKYSDGTTKFISRTAAAPAVEDPAVDPAAAAVKGQPVGWPHTVDGSAQGSTGSDGAVLPPGAASSIVLGDPSDSALGGVGGVAGTFGMGILAASEMGREFFDPIKYGTAPSEAFSRLHRGGSGSSEEYRGLNSSILGKVRQGLGLSETELAEVDKWWNDVFLPELHIVRYGPGGTEYQGGEVDSGAPADAFSGFRRYGDFSTAQPDRPFDFRLPDLGPFETRLGSIERQLGPMGTIGGFTEPTGFGQFATTAGEVDPILRDIAKFQAPDLTTLLGQSGRIRRDLGSASGSFQGLAQGLPGLTEDIGNIPSLSLEDILPFSAEDISAALQGRLTPLGVGDFVGDELVGDIEREVRPTPFGISDLLGDLTGADVRGAVTPGQFGIGDFLGSPLDRAGLQRDIRAAARPTPFGVSDLIGDLTGADVRGAVTPDKFGIGDFLGTGVTGEALRGAVTPDKFGIGDFLGTGVTGEALRGRVQPTPFSISDLLGEGVTGEGIRGAVRPTPFGISDLIGEGVTGEGIRGAVRPTPFGISDLIGDLTGADVRGAVTPGQFGIGDFLGSPLDRAGLQRDIRTAAKPTPFTAADLVSGTIGPDINKLLESLDVGLGAADITLPTRGTLEDVLRRRGAKLGVDDIGLPTGPDIETVLRGLKPGLGIDDITLPTGPDIEEILRGRGAELGVDDIGLPDPADLRAELKSRFPSADDVLGPYGQGIDDLVARLTGLNVPIGGEGITISPGGMTEADRIWMRENLPGTSLGGTGSGAATSFDEWLKKLDETLHGTGDLSETVPTVDIGDGQVPATSPDLGSFLSQLQQSVSGGFEHDTTAAGLREDPLTSSLLGDFKKSQSDIRKQRLEDLQRQGVLRDGDRLRAEGELLESYGRGESNILGTAAERLRADKQASQAAGVNLGQLLTSRELGLGELTGLVGGQPTLAGRQSDLDLIGAAIAAIEAGGPGRTYDALAQALLRGMGFFPETTTRDLGGGLTLNTRLRDMIAESVTKGGAFGGFAGGGVGGAGLPTDTRLTEEESERRLELHNLNPYPGEGPWNLASHMERSGMRSEAMEEEYRELNSRDTGQPRADDPSYYKVTGELDLENLSPEQATEILRQLAIVGITEGELVDSLRRIAR